jgi:hypothetical protein
VSQVLGFLRVFAPAQAQDKKLNIAMLMTDGDSNDRFGVET